MILNLIGIGFILSLDNFRTAVFLGPLRFSWRRSSQIAMVFGFFDGLAPLVGILLGHYLAHEIGGPVADLVGPIVIGLYGLYLIVEAARNAEPGDPDLRWSVFGLPVPLSLDNLVAGAGLGLVGISPFVPALIFGAITAVMTVAGLQLGRGIARIIPIRIRWDYVVGTVLIIEAIVFGLGLIG